jgi:hypothetical protein
LATCVFPAQNSVALAHGVRRAQCIGVWIVDFAQHGN